MLAPCFAQGSPQAGAENRKGKETIAERSPWLCQISIAGSPIIWLQGRWFEAKGWEENRTDQLLLRVMDSQFVLFRKARELTKSVKSLKIEIRPKFVDADADAEMFS